MRADELLEAGEIEGYVVWKRVLRAVEELLDKGPTDGAILHRAERRKPHSGSPASHGALLCEKFN